MSYFADRELKEQKMIIYNQKISLTVHAIIFALMLSACPNSCKETKRVYFKNLIDNQVVPKNLHVEFGVEGMQVKPAGQDMEDQNSGHFHILIDDPKQEVAEGIVVPFDENHIHYGQGQTEAELNLSPGTHTLTLQFADGAHRSYGKKMATTITVHVK